MPRICILGDGFSNFVTSMLLDEQAHANISLGPLTYRIPMSEILHPIHAHLLINLHLKVDEERPVISLSREQHSHGTSQPRNVM
jgi:hypothetical protein